MGQFLDPPLSRSPPLGSSAPPNGNHASDEDLAATKRRSESSFEEEDTVESDLPTNEPSSNLTSFPEPMKVAPRGAVKYSGELKWTTV